MASRAGPSAAGGTATQQQQQQQQQQAFAALKPLCTDVLESRDDPQALVRALTALAQALENGGGGNNGGEATATATRAPLIPTAGLPACWDYVTFPLLLMLDSAATARKQPNQNGAATPPLAVPALRSDRAAEALASALLALLRRTSPPTPEQALAVLQRLAPLLALSRAQASEELRVRSLQALEAALTTPPTTPTPPPAGHLPSLTPPAQPRLLAPEALAPLAGALVHSCLTAAEAEAAAGSSGSRAARLAALRALRSVLASVGDADALAFFLPGVASGLAKLLAGAAAAMGSGAGGGAGAGGGGGGGAAVAEALDALTDAVLLTLGDDSGVERILLGGEGQLQQKQRQQSEQQQPLTAASALAALREMAGEEGATQQQQQQQPEEAPTPALPPPSAPAPATDPSPTRPRLRAERTAEWVSSSAARVQGLVLSSLPPLMAHPRPDVRLAVGRSAARLSDGCATALRPCSRALLEIALTLAQDEWPEVAAASRAWLSGAAGVGGGGAARAEEAAKAAAAAAEEAATAVAPNPPPPAAAKTTTSYLSSAVLIEELEEDDSNPLAAASALGGGGGDDDAGLLSPCAAPLPLPSDAPPPAAKPPPSRPEAAASSSSSYKQRARLASLVPSLARELGPAVRQYCGGAEGGAALAARQQPALALARRLSAALLLAADVPADAAAQAAAAGGQAATATKSPSASSPYVLEPLLFESPAALSALLDGLVLAFASDPRGAAPALSRPGLPEGPAGGAYGSGSGPGGGAVLLPRPPLAPLRLTSSDAYRALAGCARALGRAARLADARGRSVAAAANGQRPGGESSSSGHLRRVLDALAGRLSSVSSRGLRREEELGEQGAMAAAAAAAAAAVAAAAAAAAATANNGATTDTPPSSEPEIVSWRLECAAVAAVMAEVAFGASAAWAEPEERRRQDEERQQQAAAESSPSTASPPPVGAPDPAFESALLLMLEALTRERLWGLPTVLAGTDADADAAASRASAAPVYVFSDGTVSSAATTTNNNSGLRLLPSPAAAAGALQTLGENALLFRALADACGAAARAAGVRFAADGRLLRSVLLPLLERLADPCALVSGAAGVSLGSVCAACGYLQAGANDAAMPPPRLGSFSSATAAAARATAPRDAAVAALVAADADYVVDGVVRRLRDPASHPRAPQLLAALLAKAGAGAELLPLLADPARAALAGLSVLARRQAPEHGRAFLASLLEIARGAGREAAVVEAEMCEALWDVAARCDEARRERKAERRRKELLEKGQGGGGDGNSNGNGNSNAPPSAEAFFKRRLAKRAAQEARGPGDPATVIEVEGEAKDDEDDEDEDDDEEEVASEDDDDGENAAPGRRLPPAAPDARRLRLRHPEREAIDRAWRRAHAAATLAQSAAEAAAPMLLSRGLAEAVAACEVEREALVALARATRCADAEDAIFSRYARRDDALAPARPEMPRLLPELHAQWGPLVAALRSAGAAPAAPGEDAGGGGGGGGGGVGGAATSPPPQFRVPLLERLLSLLADVTILGGGRFMARRFASDAWPVIARLLRFGPAMGRGGRGGAGGGGAGRADDALLALEREAAKASGDAEAGGGDGDDSTGAGAAAAAIAALGIGDGSGKATTTKTKRASASAEEGGIAPGAAARARVAALECLCRIATAPAAPPLGEVSSSPGSSSSNSKSGQGGGDPAAAALRPFCWDVAAAAAPLLADAQPASVRDASSRLLAALARSVDPDAVWLLLVDAAAAAAEAAPTTATTALPPAPPGSWVAGLGGACGRRARAVLVSVSAGAAAPAAAAAAAASVVVPWHAVARERLAAAAAEGDPLAGW